MKKVFIVLFTILFVFPLGLQSASAQNDKNCDDFTSWREAQDYFEKNGGSPTTNVDRLDGNDRDGKVCENMFPDEPAEWTWEQAHPGTTEGGQQGGTQGGQQGTTEGGQQGGAQGGQLPQTATNYGNGIIAGLTAMMFGAVFFLRKKKKTGN